MKIKGILTVMAIVVSLVLVLPLQANAAATTQSLLGASWDHDPITVYVSMQKRIASSYEDQVITAFEDWINALNAESGSENFNVLFLTKKPSKRNPADITVTVRKNTGMVLGSTWVTSSGGVMKSTKITLAAYNAMGLPLEESDFRTIARHEIGHALGLGHSNDNGQEPLDLMSPTFDFVGVNSDILPSSLNINAVLAIYGGDGFGKPNTSSIPPTYP